MVEQEASRVEIEIAAESNFSVELWRRKVESRCEDMGWHVPQIAQMHGYRLFELERLLREARMKPVPRYDPRTGDKEVLRIEHVLGGDPRSYEALKKIAESLDPVSEYDPDNPGVLERQKKRADDARAVLEARLAEEAKKRKEQERADSLTSQGYRR